MAKLTPKEEADILALLEKQVALRQQISSSVDDYITALKDIKTLQKNISHIETLHSRKQADIVKMNKKLVNLTGEEREELEYQIALETKKLELLDSQIKKRKSDLKLIADAAREVNKGKMSLVATAKTVSKIPSLLTKGLGMLRTSGLFEMDRSMKMSAISMGLLNKQTTGFRNTLRTSSYETQQMGVSLEDLAAMQADYSAALGRAVILGKEGDKALSAMAKGTILGAEGAAQMAGELDKFGYSAEKTRDFIEDATTNASKLGLNAGKVIKNIQNNIKLLNRYNFKDGVKGLEKMSNTAEKLGVQMDFAAGLSDKLFNIEGAVDLSAQLQVLGGKWAQLADPFKLMYMAINDVDGLTKALGDAAESAYHFDKATGDFKSSSLEIRRLKQIADQTGVSFDELSNAGRNAAKFTKIKSQIKFDVDDKTKEYLISASRFENGKAVIDINGNPKLLNALNSADITFLKKQGESKANLEQISKNALNFDDKFNKTLSIFKTSLIPLVDELNNGLGPKIEGLVNKIVEGKWLDRLSNFAGSIGKIVSKLSGIFLDHPIISAIAGAGALFVKSISSAAIWFKNGLMLAKGFNSGASGGGMMNGIGGGFGKMGKFGKMFGSTGGKIAMGAGAGIIGGGIDALNADSIEEGAGNIAGSIIGGIIGSFFGPGIGTAIGAGLGSMVGGYIGNTFASKPVSYDTPIHDGIVPSIDNNFSEKRGLIQKGKITPIDNRDDLIAYKPNGPIDNAIKSYGNKNQKSSSVEIKLSPLKIEFGDIKVVDSRSGDSTKISLLKDESFIRNLSRLVNEAVAKASNGGRLNPNPI